MKDVISGKIYRIGDSETLYNVSNGARNFDFDVSGNVEMTVQVHVGTLLDAADATISIQGSNDGTHYDDISATNSVTIPSAANSSGSLLVEYFPWAFCRIVFTPNSVTSGTIGIKADIKERNTKY